MQILDTNLLGKIGNLINLFIINKMRSNYCTLNQTYLHNETIMRENFTDLVKVIYGYSWSQGINGKFYYY
jgi:hypothetical protein